jgi:hypothetical protein
VTGGGGEVRADESAAGSGGEIVQFLLLLAGILGALRRVLLHRHAPAHADAAALVNLLLESANKVRIVRASVVPALVKVLRSGSSSPEAREHAAGALFGWCCTSAIGVLGVVPSLLDLLAEPSLALALHGVVRPNRNELFFLRGGNCG